MKNLLTIFLLLASNSLNLFSDALRDIVVISPYKVTSDLTRNSVSPIRNLEAQYPQLDITYFTLYDSDFSEVSDYDNYISSVVAHFQKKAPDMVVLVGASDFIITKDLNEAWPGIPMVLCGEFDYMSPKEYVLSRAAKKDVQREPLSDYVPQMNLTLIQAPSYYESTLDLVKNMTPGLKEVVFVGGEDYYSFESQVIMEDLVESNGYEFTPFIVTGKKLSDLKELHASKNMTRTAFIYKSTFAREDNDFYRKNIEDDIPLFYLHYMDRRGDYGAVGYVGYSQNIYENTIEDILKQVIFDDVQPRDIPFTRLEQTSPRVNVSAAEHFGYSRKSIPDYAEQTNIPPTFWQANQDLLISLFLITLLAILSINFAVFAQRKNRILTKTSKELEKANKLLEQAKNKAQDDSNQKSRFVQNMSHDVRSPINAIVGFAQLLGLPDGMLTEEEKAEYNGYIENNAQMLLMLVDDILNIADIESGKYKIEKTECSCNGIAKTSVKCTETRAQAGVNMYLTSEVDDNYLINTDPRRVQQILVNYLTNACKHTEKGEIHVHVSTSENPGKVTFSVTDTGHGIPAEMAEDIFERFKKLDIIEGHGLGLNICSTLAEKLGAVVKLDTSYTNGARFLLII